jgi:hypothetical protein
LRVKVATGQPKDPGDARSAKPTAMAAVPSVGAEKSAALAAAAASQDVDGVLALLGDSLPEVQGRRRQYFLDASKSAFALLKLQSSACRAWHAPRRLYDACICT